MSNTAKSHLTAHMIQIDHREGANKFEFNPRLIRPILNFTMQNEKTWYDNNNCDCCYNCELFARLSWKTENTVQYPTVGHTRRWDIHCKTFISWSNKFGLGFFFFLILKY